MLRFVKNHFGQVSLVAADPFEKGQVVFDLDLGEFFESPSFRTIELATSLHVDSPYGRYTNHHCEPSCYVSKGDRTMRAARNIMAGEEITFNYTVSETNLAVSFECRCGASNCMKYVTGAGSTPSPLVK